MAGTGDASVPPPHRTAPAPTRWVDAHLAPARGATTFDAQGHPTCRLAWLPSLLEIAAASTSTGVPSAAEVATGTSAAKISSASAARVSS